MEAVVKFSLIMAVSENNGIGYMGKLPWNLKNELAYFNRMTKNVSNICKQNAVIMGRYTWEESIPDARKPLAGRLNIVLSSREMKLPCGALHFYNMQEVIKKLSTPPLVDQIETAWVIGGAKLYESVIADNLAHRIYMTHIKKTYPADVFVNINLSKFREVTDPRVPQDEQEEDGTKYVYKVYEKL